MRTFFANPYVLSTYGTHKVYMGSPCIFYIYMIKCGWLGPHRQHFACYSPLFIIIQKLKNGICTK